MNIYTHTKPLEMKKQTTTKQQQKDRKTSVATTTTTTETAPPTTTDKNRHNSRVLDFCGRSLLREGIITDWFILLTGGLFFDEELLRRRVPEDYSAAWMIN